MTVSQKCQYALRALFELAKRSSADPVRTADLAASQAIPLRFLETILAELRQGGFVVSRRGQEGGYLLARPASRITVGDLVTFIDGPLVPVKCMSESDDSCRLKGDCAFMWMWLDAAEAVSRVYDGITLEDLVRKERQRAAACVRDYSI